MSQTQTKTRTRVTKKDLEERDKQIATLREEIQQRQEEIDARIATTLELEQSFEEMTRLAEHAAAEGLRTAVDAHDHIRWGIAVSEELGLVANGLFNRLQFATQTLSSVLAYRGEDVEVPRQLAQGALSDLAPFVHEATTDQAFDPTNLVSEAWDTVLLREGVDPATLGQEQEEVPSLTFDVFDTIEFGPEEEGEFLKTISTLFKEDPFNADLGAQVTDEKIISHSESGPGDE